jgi:hypothetical protein
MCVGLFSIAVVQLNLLEVGRCFWYTISLQFETLKLVYVYVYSPEQCHAMACKMPIYENKAYLFHHDQDSTY